MAEEIKDEFEEFKNEGHTYTNKKSIPDYISEQRKEFVEFLLNRIEAGAGIWQRGWDINLLKPERQNTGVPYKGKNRYKLGLKTALKGYDDNRWFTYNQVKALGEKIFVKKGEKSTKIDFWKTETAEDIQERLIYERKKAISKAEGKEISQIRLTMDDFNDIDKKVKEILGDRKANFIFQIINVFNANQVEGLPKKKIEKTKPSETEIEDMVDNLIESSRCPVKFAMQERAMYFPKRDEIVLPTRESFDSERQLLATLIHEMGHSQKNRDLKPGEKKDSYAVEELKAEFTSLFVQSDLGINLSEESVLDNSAEYIKGWGEELIKNPSILDNIIKDAEKRSNEIVQSYQKVLEAEKVLGFEKKEEKIEEKPYVPAVEKSKIVENTIKEIKESFLFGVPEDNDIIFDKALESNNIVEEVDEFFKANSKRYLPNFMETLELPEKTLHLTTKQFEAIEKEGAEKFVSDNRLELKKIFHKEVHEAIGKLVDKSYSEIPAFMNGQWNEEEKYIKATLREYFRQNYADDNFKGKGINFVGAVQKAFETKKAAIEKANDKVETAVQDQVRTN